MKVKYFAWVRERVGKSEETVEPPASVRTVDDLIRWLAERGRSCVGCTAGGDECGGGGIGLRDGYAWVTV